MVQSSMVDIAIECLLAGSSGRDPEERHHCRRVEKLCAATADEMHWCSEEISDLRLAALLHHMDRSLVPESALAPGVAAYLNRFSRRASDPEARVMPLRTRADEGASIIAVADTFDRLTSAQRYRRPLKDTDALEVLRHDAQNTADERTVEALYRAHTQGSQLSERKAA